MSTLKTYASKRVLTAVVVMLLAVAVMVIAGLVEALSALLLAIVVGAVVRNIRLVPSLVASEVAWASKKLLRIGIVLLGFRLSLTALVDIGVQGVVTLLVTVAVTFLGTIAIGRALRVSRGMGLLVATGFSICGASAIAAMSSVVDPESKGEEDTVQAIALVTIFGTIAMFVLPPLALILGLSDAEAGVWIGASVHEVAQVVAAGGMVSVGALALATVAKLGRVVLLAPLIAIMSGLERRRVGNVTGARPPILPLFVAGFLLAVVVRTFVPLPAEALEALELASTLLLAAAMLGLGFGVDIRKLISTGWRPLALGALSTLLAATSALVVLQALGV